MPTPVDNTLAYIILGPPKNIEYYDNVMNVYPTQIWFYQGNSAYGLPAGFNVIFFKEKGLGEYILYSPSDHGPQSLIADYTGDETNVKDAYKRLMKLEPNLARQILSLIPGERSSPEFISLASNNLLGNIFALPLKKVEDTYADAIRKYKDIIEVEYSANYIHCDSLVRVIYDDSGFFMVNYSVEPKKLSVDFYDDKYNAHFELNGMISDEDGKPVFQYSKEIPLSFTQDQITDIKTKSFALQDMFPLIPGQYSMSLLIKNTDSKEFTSIEESITIPSITSGPQMSPLILGYGPETDKVLQESVPFKIRNTQLLCQSRRVFASKENLILFFQLWDWKPAINSKNRLRFTFEKDDSVVFSKEKNIQEYPSPTNILEKFELREYSPGYYRIKVSLLDKEGKELLSQSGDFEISYVQDISRPLIISKIITGFPLGENLYSIGIQNLNAGEIQTAISLLEKAYAQNPGRENIKKLVESLQEE